MSTRSNAFDLLRLFGALLVIVEHSWVLSGHGPAIAATTTSGLGTAGVGIFFVTSGYLITTSWLADPSPRRYAMRRALRILPNYVLVIAATAFVLGPIVTVLSTADYFTSSGTWTYLLRNLAVFPVTYDLPGVFTGVPVPGVVNGSLWTIRVEMLCYIGVAVLGLCRLLHRRSVLILLVALCLGLAVTVKLSGYDGLLYPLPVAADAAEPLTFFAIGMLAREFGPRVSPPWWITALTLTLWVVSWGTFVENVAGILATACFTFTVAFRAPRALHHPTRGWDLSYGTYVFAYPVQQVLVQSGLRSPWLVMAATVAIVLPMAALSWRLLEQPALRHKPHRPIPAPSVKDAGPGVRDSLGS